MVTEEERTFESNLDSEAERIQNHKLLCSQIQQFQFCSHSVVLLSVLVPVMKFSSQYIEHYLANLAQMMLTMLTTLATCCCPLLHYVLIEYTLVFTNKASLVV